MSLLQLLKSTYESHKLNRTSFACLVRLSSCFRGGEPRQGKQLEVQSSNLCFPMAIEFGEVTICRHRLYSNSWCLFIIVILKQVAFSKI